MSDRRGLIALDLPAGTSVPSEVLDEIGALADNLTGRKGPGHEMLGWLDLPEQSLDLLPIITGLSEMMRHEGAALVCIGIGGSYLGAKAAIHALASGAGVYFAGHQLSSTWLNSLMQQLQDRPVYLNVISKSGTTTEPAIAFRILRDWLRKKHPADWEQRIIATTDPTKGALRQMADAAGWGTVPIPPDVGGRFSVLSSVGLLPMAVAGVDLHALLEGATHQLETLLAEKGNANPAHQLAALRTHLYRQGTKIEVLSTFHPELFYLAEWWKQLTGESEGKEGQGLFPAACSYTTDLHSLGQWLQDGPRHVMETFLWVKNTDKGLSVPELDNSLDGLDYLAGREIETINRTVLEATLQAHTDGGVPCNLITMPGLDAASLGALFVFFEVAVALTGYAVGINPFDQPGVEAYKTEMFKRLGKPGF